MPAVTTLARLALPYDCPLSASFYVPTNSVSLHTARKIFIYLHNLLTYEAATFD